MRCLFSGIQVNILGVTGSVGGRFKANRPYGVAII